MSTDLQEQCRRCSINMGSIFTTANAMNRYEMKYIEEHSDLRRGQRILQVGFTTYCEASLPPPPPTLVFCFRKRFVASPCVSPWELRGENEACN